METKDVLRIAQHFRAYAEHFQQTDWNYTRLHEIKHIRYVGDYSGYDHPLRRIARAIPSALQALLPGLAKKDGLNRLLSSERDLRSRLMYARASLMVGLRTDSHRPDGVLDGGNVITHWEETGEYLQFVQPSVGSKIADFLEAEPESPHAQAIAAEMARISEAYGARCDAGEVDGRTAKTGDETL